MKKLFLWATALVMMASCSQDEITNPGGNKPTGGETHYLTVNIVAGNENTRASNEDEEGYEANGSEYGKYEDGTETENQVNSVRFYFFDDDKTAVDVVKYGENDFRNYYDWNPAQNGNLGSDHANSVEKILSAVVVINTSEEKGDKLPASIVAVINPTTEVKSKTINKLDDLNGNDLNGIVEDFNVTDGFVMSNSIYAEGTATVEEVSVAGHLYPDKKSAEANPVSIYVERVLAKVSVSISKDATPATEIGENVFDTDIEVDGKKVYAQFLGWNVTATADKSYLMKHIKPTWGEDLFGAGNPWNWAGHRSFWAINPTGIEPQYGPFVEPEENPEENPEGNPEGNPETNNTNVAQAIKGFTDGVTDTPNYTYLHENAANTTNNYVETPSQVIVAAQLVDESGEPFEVAEYAGQRYKGKESVLKLIANAANIYKKEDDGTYTKIAPADIKFITASAANEISSGRYFVYAVIDDKKYNYDTFTFYCKESGEGDDAQFKEYTDIKAANENLKALGHAKVWKTGYTYYYFNIRHLAQSVAADKTEATTPGYYGVVRNHVYKNTIKAVSGLGTPVYDPNEEIIPETPEDDDTFIAAQIKILSWRIVNNSDIILGM